MTSVNTLALFSLLVPVLVAIPSVVSRNPIHAILWLISTFLTTCGIVFYNYKLGFTCSLIIIIYIGAIAILSLFIIMMIPLNEKFKISYGATSTIGQFIVLFLAYVGGGYLLIEHLVENVTNNNSVFWSSIANQLDSQLLYGNVGINEVEGLSLLDLYVSDIAIYGAKLYQDFAFPIVLTGILLLFVLVAAIVLCKEE